MVNFNTTLSLIKLDKKISKENYPTILYQDDKETFRECDAMNKILNYSWNTMENITLEDLIEMIEEGYSFCPSEFNENTSNKGTGFPLDLEYRYSRIKDGNDKNKVYYKNRRLYDDDVFTKIRNVRRIKSNFKRCQIAVMDIDFGYISEQELLDKIKNSPLKDCSFIYKSINDCITIGWVLKESTDYIGINSIVSILYEYFNINKQITILDTFYPSKYFFYKNLEIKFDINTFKNIKNDIYEFNIKTNDIKNDKDLFFELNMLKFCLDKDRITNFDFKQFEQNPLINDFLYKQLNKIELDLLSKYLYWISGGLKWIKEIMDKNNESKISLYENDDFEILKINRKLSQYPLNLDFYKYYNFKEKSKNSIKIQNVKLKNKMIKKEYEILGIPLPKVFNYYVYCIKNSNNEIVYYGKTKNIPARESIHNYNLKKKQQKIHEYWNKFETGNEIILTPIKGFDTEEDALHYEMKCILDNYFSETGFTLHQDIPKTVSIKQENKSKSDLQLLNENINILRNQLNNIEIQTNEKINKIIDKINILESKL